MTNATMTEPTTTTDPSAALAATAILSLRLRKPSARRQARDGSVVVKGAEGDDPDEDSTRVSVELLRADTYSAIVKHDQGTRAIVRAESLPAGRRVAAGCYLLPVAAVERVFTALDRRRDERAALVEAFVADYPAIVQDAVERLGDAFDLRMFPGTTTGDDGRAYVSMAGAGIMRDAFDIAYELEVADREAGVRAAAGSLSAAFVETQMAKARASGEAMLAEIRDGLRVAFAGLVDKAREALRPAVEGERKAFRKEHVERVQAFLAVFAERNVAGDGDLAAIVEKARAVIGGVDAETLKGAKNVDPRRALAAALDDVARDLEPVLAPKRRVTLEDE